jgi:hypothetical protein
MLTNIIIFYNIIMNYIDAYGTTDYVNIEEIKSFGNLKYEDIRVEDEENFIQGMAPVYNVFVKNSPIGKKNSFYINKLFTFNNIPVPDNFAQHSNYNNFMNPKQIILMAGGGNFDYKKKYIKYKYKYLLLKNKLKK